MTRLPETIPKHLFRALHKGGFLDEPQKGLDLVLRHPDGRRVTVPIHPRPLNSYLLKLMSKQAGMREEEFREIG